MKNKEETHKLTERDWANIGRVQNGLDILEENECKQFDGWQRCVNCDKIYNEHLGD